MKVHRGFKSHRYRTDEGPEWLDFQRFGAFVVPGEAAISRSLPDKPPSTLGGGRAGYAATRLGGRAGLRKTCRLLPAEATTSAHNGQECALCGTRRSEHAIIGACC